jgi:colanic acid/amylovoran biosynthesis glycosyltransferase
MASGMPVVGTRHAGIPELVEDGVSGWLVPERDEAARRARSARGRPGDGPRGPRGPRQVGGSTYHRLNDRFADMLQTLIRPEARPR